MALPTELLATDKVDANGDSLSDARVQLLAGLQAINGFIGAVAAPAGLATLDALGHVPLGQLEGESILTQLLNVDGTGSSLDADLLDGLEATDLVRVDGSHALDTSLTTGWLVKRQTTVDDARARAITLQGINTPGATDIGYGIEIRAQLNDSSGTLRDAGAIGWEWTDATSPNPVSDVVFSQRNGDGNFTTALRIVDRKIQFQEVSGPGANPPTGFWWLYFTSTGLKVKDDGGTVTSIGGSGGGAHGSLTGLASGDDHPQYFRNDGTHAMTADLALGANSILFTDLGGDPSQPASGTMKLYTKGGQLYYRNNGGVVGPIIVGGGGGGGPDHGDLGGLGDDDHTQYLLRQPTDDVVINDAGDDFDFVIEGDTEAKLFYLNAGEDAVGFGHNPTDGSLGRVQIVSPNGMRGLGVTTTDSHGVSVATATGTAFVGAVSGGGSGLSLTRTATSPAAALIAAADNSSGGLAAHFSQAAAGASALRVDVSGVGLAFLVASSEVVVNENATAGMDFRVEGDTLSRLLFIDASADVVNVNGQLTTGRLNVTGGGIPAIYAISASVSQPAIIAEVSADTTAIIGRVSTGTRGSAFAGSSCQDFVASFVKDLDGEDPIDAFAVNITVLNNADTAAGLRVSHFGTGDLVLGESIDGIRFRFPNGGGCEFAELASDMPTPPLTGHWGLFFKADGLYTIDDTGAVSGPLGTGGGGGIVTSEAGVVRQPDHFEEVVTCTSGAGNANTTQSVPAGCLIERVLVETITTVSGGFVVGMRGIVDQFASMTGSVGETNLAHSGWGPPVPVGGPGGANIQIRPAAGGTFPATGTVRVTVFFLRFTIP